MQGNSRITGLSPHRSTGWLWLNGGESGIRTHGTVSRTHAFQACALSHSAISPDRLSWSGTIVFARDCGRMRLKFAQLIEFVPFLPTAPSWPTARPGRAVNRKPLHSDD